MLPSTTGIRYETQGVTVVTGVFVGKNPEPSPVSSRRLRRTDNYSPAFLRIKLSRTTEGPDRVQTFITIFSLRVFLSHHTDQETKEQSLLESGNHEHASHPRAVLMAPKHSEWRIYIMLLLLYQGYYKIRINQSAPPPAPRTHKLSQVINSF